MAPDAPAAPAEAPGLSLPSLPTPSLPSLPTPSLPSLPGVPGLPSLPALPQVEINPIANIEVERPSVPDDAAPIEYDDLVKKARLGGVTKVEFLSANGDVAVATLSDGSLRSIKVEDDKSGSYKLAAKMRDYGVPYTYSFNLGKFNEAAKRTSMRSKNQNVLDAEARQRDEDARLAALDARLAAERSSAGHRPAGRVNIRCGMSAGFSLWQIFVRCSSLLLLARGLYTTSIIKIGRSTHLPFLSGRFPALPCARCLQSCRAAEHRRTLKQESGRRHAIRVAPALMRHCTCTCNRRAPARRENTRYHRTRAHL